MINEKYYEIFETVIFYSMEIRDKIIDIYMKDRNSKCDHMCEPCDIRADKLNADTRRIICEKSCLNQPSSSCRNLIMSCERNHIYCVKRYTEKFAEKYEINTILTKHMKCIYDNFENISVDIIKYWLDDKQAICPDEFIDMMCENGNYDVVKYLIEHHRKDCSDDAIKKVVRNNHVRLVEYLLVDRCKKEKLWKCVMQTAVEFNKTDVIDMMINNKLIEWTNEIIQYVISGKNQKLIKYLSDNRIQCSS